MIGGPDRQEMVIRIVFGLITGLILGAAVVWLLPEAIREGLTIGLILIAVTGIFTWLAVRHGDRAYHLLARILEWW